MNTTLKPLSAAKAILFTIACIAIFIAIAVICGVLTGWIANNTIKIAVREVLVRTPLTIAALHFFARRFIKTYNPAVIYGKLKFIKLVKWTAVAFILPLVVGLFYYLFHFMVPLAPSLPLKMGDKMGLFIKWVAVSIAAGLTEEILFRGHLYMIINSRYSKVKSIFITSLIFGIVHIAMLPAITPLDVLIVLIGGTIAGIMFSLIYHYTKAVWYVAMVHIVWDIFFIGKITTIAATQAEANQAIAAFKLTTHNLLLTGGNFGIEATLPCFIVYLLVTAGVYKLMKCEKIGAQ